MRELTKPQKIKVLDEMILLLKNSHKSISLCYVYGRACYELNYKIDTSSILAWTPRLIELNTAIRSEIKRTGGYAYINYFNWTDDRINLLKKVKKQLC